MYYSDGLGRSGTLCTLAISLQSHRAEKVVDVFQTIKKMQTEKPDVVQSVVAKS